MKFLPLTLSLALLLGDPAAVVRLAAAQQGKCFDDREELKTTIDDWIDNDCGSGEDRCPELAGRYGWPMNSWCTSRVTDMHFLFVEKRNFNEDISDWDTSANTDLYETFSYATSFNGDLSKWDTSKVTKAYGLFNGATAFNRDLNSWDMSSMEGELLARMVERFPLIFYRTRNVVHKHRFCFLPLLHDKMEDSHQQDTFLSS